MKTIKLLGKESYFLDDLIDGESTDLTKSVVEIDSFSLNNSLENQTRYIIELSPDENNPLNYDGITIALKIYFKHLQEKLYEFEILLFGFDTKESIFLNSDYSFFLKCPNVDFKTLNFTNHWHLEDQIKPISKEEAKTALMKLNIKPPTSYKTHHSIANEWAIFRWSNYLGINTSLKTEITNSLYFQYLITIHEIEQVVSKQNFLPAKGKILIIDDEIEKGWEDFFKGLKLPSVKDLKIEGIVKGFKSLENQDQVINFIEEKIKTFGPDTIILDLRLLDSDFSENNPKRITGYKVLEKIKTDINPGIQVILFTASNKVWNYQALNSIGFDGWVTKESPELSADPDFTQKTIKNMKKSISDSLDRKYLVKTYEEKKELEKKIDGIQYDNNFKEQIINQLNLSFYLLNKANKKEEFAYAFISLYMIIETVNNHFLHQNGDDNYWYVLGEKLKNWTYSKGEYVDYNKTEDKMTGELFTVEFVIGSKPAEWKKLAGLYFQIWNGKDQKFVHEIYHLIKKRNGFVHNDHKILDITYKDKDKKNILDKKGKPIYLNHDIYKPEGYIKLFGVIKEVISQL
jgi:CheY-like chemotaxis protein